MAQSWQLDKTGCHRTDRPGQWASHGSGGGGGGRGREKGKVRVRCTEVQGVHTTEIFVCIRTYTMYSQRGNRIEREVKYMTMEVEGTHTRTHTDIHTLVRLKTFHSVIQL